VAAGKHQRHAASHATLPKVKVIYATSCANSIRNLQFQDHEVTRHSFALTNGAAAAALALMLIMSPAPARASVFLEDQTWTELRDLVKAGSTTIIIPIGGTEQNGPYMALGKHNVRVKYLARKIAEKLGDALVAPVMAYVPEGGIEPPAAHMKFPGTITISDTAFGQILDSAARSFKHAGFTAIVFIGDHGSYQSDLSAAADRLNHEWAKGPAKAFAAREYYAITQGPYVEKLKSLGHAQSEIGTHAGLADTSLMLAVDPALVRMDRIAAGPKPGAADGVYGGDPARSSAELGQLGVDLIVNGTVDAIRKFTAVQNSK
jgi:creatinine amidohydrolase